MRSTNDRSREGPALHSWRWACAGIYPREVDTCLHTDVHTRVHRPGNPCPTPATLGGRHAAQLASGGSTWGQAGVDQGAEMLDRTEMTALESRTALT